MLYHFCSNKPLEVNPPSGFPLKKVFTCNLLFGRVRTTGVLSPSLQQDFPLAVKCSKSPWETKLTIFVSKVMTKLGPHSGTSPSWRFFFLSNSDQDIDAWNDFEFKYLVLGDNNFSYHIVNLFHLLPHLHLLHHHHLLHLHNCYKDEADNVKTMVLESTFFQDFAINKLY